MGCFTTKGTLVKASLAPDVPFRREYGDIETAVVNLVRRLAPVIPVAQQPQWARTIAAVIASMPTSMGDAMFLRQSLIRGGTATHDHVVEGLATWVTVTFDLANLQRDRAAALDLPGGIPEDALERLARAVSTSRHGCILAMPHAGSLELFVASIKDHGFDIGFVYKIGEQPTPRERWIYEGRSATQATPIEFARRETGGAISNILRNRGVVMLVTDIYPSFTHKGICVNLYGEDFAIPPGPARFARTGTLVLPAVASGRRADGFSANIFDPIEYRTELSVRDGANDFSQRLADRIVALTAADPGSFWLWHAIPNDPFLAAAQRRRPDLVRATPAGGADDEAAAAAVDALGNTLDVRDAPGS